MNQLVRIEPARARHLARDTFEAWHGSGIPIDVSAASTLPEVVAIAARQSTHKGRFVIQHNRADARRVLHFYSVTKSSKKGFWRDALDGGPRVFEGNLEPKPLMSMQVIAPLQPVAPWQWSADDYMGEKHGICPDLAAVTIDA